MMELDTIFCGDALNVLRTLPDNFVHCCITSPPYYALRDYGAEGQIGREDTPTQYVARLTEVFPRFGAFSDRTAHYGSTLQTPTAAPAAKVTIWTRRIQAAETDSVYRLRSEWKMSRQRI